MSVKKIYATPAIETLDSSEILELIGPVQGYGPGTSVGTGGIGTISPASGGSGGSTTFGLR